MHFETDKSDYGLGSPSKNSYSNVQAATTYSNQEDIFKAAFKHIPPLKNIEGKSDFPILKPEEFANIRSGPSIPGEDDGYPNAGIEAPNSVSHYGGSGEYREPPSPHSHSSKGYVAPIFDVPNPNNVVFNQRQGPVKYALQPKLPKAYFSQRNGAYEQPAAELGFLGETGGQDHSEYAVHHAADYHHKPEKHKWKKGGGESFKSDHHSSHGEKGDKGFKKYHDFDEGEMGHHGKEGKKGYFDKESGHKKSHHHEGHKHGESHGKLHGDKGVKYGEEEAHKKGHKTSGYHNIFHKDEFKKEHKFYDDAHKHGHHEKHGGYHTSHGKKHGQKSSGGFQDSAFDQGHKGDSGTYKKGHFDQDHKGHKGASGHESHWNHHKDYAKKGGHSEKDKFGYHHGH